MVLSVVRRVEVSGWGVHRCVFVVGGLVGELWWCVDFSMCLVIFLVFEFRRAAGSEVGF